MSIFLPQEPLGRSSSPRFKIKLTAEDGQVLYWQKRGRVHTLEEDVADLFVANFKPELFQVRPDGTLGSPVAGETKAILRVEKEPAME